MDFNGKKKYNSVSDVYYRSIRANVSGKLSSFSDKDCNDSCFSDYDNLSIAVKEQNLDNFKKIFDNEGLDDMWDNIGDLFQSKNTDTIISIEMIKYAEYVKRKKHEKEGKMFYSDIEYISNRGHKIAEFMGDDCINLFSFFISQRQSKYSNGEEFILGFLICASREKAFDCMNFILSSCSEATIKKNQEIIMESLYTILYYQWDRIYYGKKENEIKKNIELYNKAINIIIKYLDKNTLNKSIEESTQINSSLDDYNKKINEFRIKKLMDLK